MAPSPVEADEPLRQDCYGSATAARRALEPRAAPSLDDGAVNARAPAATVRAASTMIFALLAVLSGLLALAGARAAGLVPGASGGAGASVIDARDSRAAQAAEQASKLDDRRAVSSDAGLSSYFEYAEQLQATAQRRFASRADARAAIAAAQQQRMTLTPFGLFPDDCIHELPSDDAVLALYIKEWLRKYPGLTCKACCHSSKASW